MPDDADLKIAGFRMWVFGRQFSNAVDEWDGNWLSVKCECEANGARVRATGAFVSLVEIYTLGRQMETLLSGSAESADIDFLEPELKICFKLGARGTAEFIVELTPDPLHQQHRFIFDIDVSYFGDAIAQCNEILREYPLRGLAR